MPPSDRYTRQSLLSVIGAEGQRRILESRVLVVGCGALGSTQAEHLARAGVGHLRVVDRDVLELHNLQRQSLFGEEDVRDRLPKALAAQRRLRAINADIQVEGRVMDVTPDGVEALVGDADVVVDGTDNFETRFLVNDAAVKLGRPWIYGGVVATEGTVMAVRPGQGPCLRCILPQPPPPGQAPTCETLGILNTAVAWVAALQVTEALRILVGAPPPPPRLHTLDIWKGTASAIQVPRSPTCPCCQDRRFDFLTAERGSTTTTFCGRNAVQVSPEGPVSLDLPGLARRLEPLVQVRHVGMVLEVLDDEHRLIVFPDGRVLVMGTTDPARARSLVSRYIGV